MLSPMWQSSEAGTNDVQCLPTPPPPPHCVLLLPSSQHGFGDTPCGTFLSNVSVYGEG